MKRLLFAITPLLFAVVVCFSLPRANATTGTMTEAHLNRIRSNCISAQSSLTRLHANDALIRVDRGQLYELILTKLMSPLNSRIALNDLNSLSLPAIASRYDQQLQLFRDRYKTYEESLSATLRIDCVKRPVAFYDGVADARNKRKLVHDSTLSLARAINEYKQEFEKFAHTVGGDK